MIDTLGYILAYFISLPVFVGKFTFFYTKRTWCVAFHHNKYVRVGGTCVYCPKCDWKMEPWDWGNE
jgi:Sec-independent protein secretion pathway component TatC